MDEFFIDNIDEILQCANSFDLSLPGALVRDKIIWLMQKVAEEQRLKCSEQISGSQGMLQDAIMETPLVTESLKEKITI